MRILPPTTEPASLPIERRHTPQPSRRWSDYRACLRWDFAFSCAFCLLHEADLYGPVGGEGLAGTTAEHVVPRSVAPERAGDYRNLIYACRFCNTARSDRPNLHDGRRLLDPTSEAWCERFAATEDYLEPTPDDLDAAYTAQVYDINDPRKVGRRGLRRRLLEDRLSLVTELQSEMVRLFEIADVLLEAGDLPKFRALIDDIGALRTHTKRAIGDLKRFPAMPMDHPQACRCRTTRHHHIPSWFADQTIDISI